MVIQKKKLLLAPFMTGPNRLVCLRPSDNSILS